MNARFDAAESPLVSLSDELLLDRLQRGAFAYFEQNVNPDNGLIADTSRPGSPCSIAVVGMALSSYPVAVSRGWISRDVAAARTIAALRFFADSAQSADPDATGYRGFYYHFLDMSSGKRVWQCELSLIDTALLLAGILVAGSFYDGAGVESEIRTLSDALYRRVDWRWTLRPGETVAQGWKPEYGFLHYGWEGYNEATLLYILGMGSPTHPLPVDSFARWTSTYQWENLLGYNVLYSGPLFTHLFSHAWIDLRRIRDAFMREKQSDYFDNTKSAIAIQREYCARNPRNFVGYERNLWGISAGEGPTHVAVHEPLHDRRFFGYMSRGVPYGPDDGTLSPWAMLACVPFDHDAALTGVRRLLSRYPQVCRQDRFSSGFNPTLNEGDGGWLSDGWYGLDQGMIVLMIENYRSGWLWELTRNNDIYKTGLRLAGFSGGWL